MDFQVLEVCLRLDIKCVTIYVFSIENFSRPPEEVNALMEMARGRFHDLAQQGWVRHDYSDSSVQTINRLTSLLSFTI